MIVRSQLSTIIERIQEPRKCIQVLAGPRQVGKTTLIKQFLAQCTIPATSLNADEVATNNRAWISEKWQSVRIRMQLEGQQEHILIIDEVQKIDNWSEIVKKEWDYDTFHDINIKLILLGSSRLLLKDGLTESLMGRFELIRVPHWSYTEMHEAFNFSIEQYIYFGGYPGAAPYVNNEKRWRQYMRDSIIEPAINRDVLMTKRVLKPALMRQLFEIGCAYSGEIIAFNKIIGQLNEAGNTSTLANYLKTLDEASLLGGLQRYAVDFARRYQSIPKYQVYNTALLSYFQGRGFKTEQLDPSRWGRWVESAIGAHLINHAQEQDYDLYYWRDHNDEVDFIIRQTGNRLMALEVKSGHRQDNSGLHVFADKFHPEHSLVVGGDAFPTELFFSNPIERFLSL